MFDPSEKRKWKNGFYPGMLGPAWDCLIMGFREYRAFGQNNLVALTEFRLRIISVVSILG